MMKRTKMTRQLYTAGGVIQHLPKVWEGELIDIHTRDEHPLVIFQHLSIATDEDEGVEADVISLRVF